MFLRRLQAGFTLIEVLVVIAIIGILSSVLYANFNGARQEARNKSMQSELKETQLALEVYRAQNGVYPDAPASCRTVTSATTTSNTTACAGVDFIVGLVPDFIAELPDASKSGNTSCVITYTVDTDQHNWYKLTAQNCHYTATSTAGVSQTSEMARCPASCSSCAGTALNAAYRATAPFYETYAVYSAGGQCE